MTPIDSLLAAKKAIAASEAAELAKDYRNAELHARAAKDMLGRWIEELYWQREEQHHQQRRDKGLADVTEVMAEQYRADNRQGD